MYIFTHIASFAMLQRGGDESDREKIDRGSQRGFHSSRRKAAKTHVLWGFLGERLCDNQELLWN